MDDLLLRRVRPGLGGELADVRVNDGLVTAITSPGSDGFAARVVDGHGGTLVTLSDPTQNHLAPPQG